MRGWNCDRSNWWLVRIATDSRRQRRSARLRNYDLECHPIDVDWNSHLATFELRGLSPCRSQQEVLLAIFHGLAAVKYSEGGRNTKDDNAKK
jgi:hypothetical protein